MTSARSHCLAGFLTCLVLALAPDAAESQTRIGAGQAVNGRLASSDPSLSDGSHYHVYEYRGSPGERIQITLRSGDFDTFLSGGPLQGGDVAVEDSDDDGAGGTDSMLEVTVGPSGAYGIRANSYSDGETGAYTLSGQEASLLMGRRLSADAGAYVVSGQDAVLLLARRVAASAGSYSLNGQTVTLVYSGAEALVTPDSRIYIVPAEDRVFVVVTEERTFAVDAENRTLVA